MTTFQSFPEGVEIVTPSIKVPTPAITTNDTQIATTAFVKQAYRYIGTQFLTSGTGATFTPTTGASLLKVKVYGATGGGGGVDGQGASTVALGAAGGNGGYTEKNFTVSGQTFTYTIGAAGVGGAAGNNNGTAGGTTSFTASIAGAIQVTGGSGGVGMLGTGSPFSSIYQASAGVGSGGTINLTGNRGRIVGWSSLGVLVDPPSNGSPLWGFGAIGATNADGSDSLGLGAGGLGAFNLGTATDYAGGDGFRGEIQIEEYA